MRWTGSLEKRQEMHEDLGWKYHMKTSHKEHQEGDGKQVTIVRMGGGCNWLRIMSNVGLWYQLHSTGGLIDIRLMNAVDSHFVSCYCSIELSASASCSLNPIFSSVARSQTHSVIT